MELIARGLLQEQATEQNSAYINQCRERKFYYRTNLTFMFYKMYTLMFFAKLLSENLRKEKIGKREVNPASTSSPVNSHLKPRHMPKHLNRSIRVLSLDLKIQFARYITFRFVN